MAHAIRERLFPIGKLGQRLEERDRDLRREFEGRISDLRREVKRSAKATERGTTRVSAELEQLGRDFDSGLRQQELLLRRLEFLTTAAPAKPVTTKSSATAGRASTLSQVADLPKDVWEVDDCPVCGHGESTVACEWNKFAVIGGAPDEDAARYDYSICHACGVLAARRRPVGKRYRTMLSNFVEVTGKEAGAREVSNPLLNPYPLTDADREHLRALIAKGVFVSDHAGVPRRDYLRGALQDRLANSVHVEILGSLVPLDDATVLEVRPRSGSILAGLKRLYGVEGWGIPIWESQQFIIKELYGIESPGLIDFEHFRISYDRQFDLIICNHMLTHMIRPREFFEEILGHLKPGGYLYLYNEPDDAEFLRRGQSMLSSLNSFHLQAFDQDSLVRALSSNGFETVFVTGRDLTHLCLARRSDQVTMKKLSVAEKDLRLSRYADARLRALLRLTPEARSRVDVDWDAITSDAVGRGLATVETSGKIRLVRAER